MQTKGKVITALIIFLAVYAVALTVWLKVKIPYGHLIDSIGAHLASISLDMDFTRLEPASNGEELISVRRAVVTVRGIADLTVDQKIIIDNYSFNMPLTAALMASFFWFFRWKWYTFAEGAVLITAGHLLYVYSYLMLNFKTALIQMGAEPATWASPLVWQFLWSFADNLVIRFEPFLVIVVLWLANRRGESKG